MQRIDGRPVIDVDAGQPAAGQVSGVVGDDGPGFQALITPDGFKTQLERVRGIIDATARDVAAMPPTSANLRNGWTAFLMRWGGFYTQHENPGILTVALSGPYNTIFSFEREVIAWRNALRSQVRFEGPEPRPSTPFGQGGQEIVDTFKDLLWGLVALGGIYIATRR